LLAAVAQSHLEQVSCQLVAGCLVRVPDGRLLDGSVCALWSGFRLLGSSWHLRGVGAVSDLHDNDSEPLRRADGGMEERTRKRNQGVVGGTRAAGVRDDRDRGSEPLRRL